VTKISMAVFRNEMNGDGSDGLDGSQALLGYTLTSLLGVSQGPRLWPAYRN
jgi:hypothetical protein